MNDRCNLPSIKLRGWWFERTGPWDIGIIRNTWIAMTMCGYKYRVQYWGLTRFNQFKAKQWWLFWDVLGIYWYSMRMHEDMVCPHKFQVIFITMMLMEYSKHQDEEIDTTHLISGCLTSTYRSGPGFLVPGSMFHWYFSCAAHPQGFYRYGLSAVGVNCQAPIFRCFWK